MTPLEAIVKPHESFESNSLLAVRDFRIYLGATFLASLAVQAQSVAVGWQVYKITASPLSLGYVGLVQFLPTLALTLHAGAAADRHDRRLIMSASTLTRAITAGAFVALSVAKVSVIWPFYLTLVVFGIARAFAAPAADSLMPRLVPASKFADAVACVLKWANRDDRRTCIGRSPVFTRACRRVLGMRSALHSQRNRIVPDSRPQRDQTDYRGSPAANAHGGNLVREGASSCAWRDLARPVCGIVRWRDSAAADLRARHPPCRSGRTRPDAQFAGDRCHLRRPCVWATATAPERWRRDARVRCFVRRRHNCVWTFQQLHSFYCDVDRPGRC